MISGHPNSSFLQCSSSDSTIFSKARHLISPSCCLQVGHLLSTLALQLEQSVCPLWHCRNKSFVSNINEKQKLWGFLFLDKQEEIIYIFIKLEGTSRQYTESRHSWSKSLYHQKWRMQIKEKTNNNITMFLKTKKWKKDEKGCSKSKETIQPGLG